MGNGNGNSKQVRRELLATLLVQTRDVVIVLAAFAAIAALGVFVVQHYNAAKDATSVLGVLVPAISTIAGMAFGVAVGARAGAAAGDATADAARKQTAAAQTHTKQALTGVAQLQSQLEPVLSAAVTTTAQVPNAEVEGTRRQLESIKQSLTAAL